MSVILQKIFTFLRAYSYRHYKIPVYFSWRPQDYVSRKDYVSEDYVYFKSVYCVEYVISYKNRIDKI